MRHTVCSLPSIIACISFLIAGGVCNGAGLDPFSRGGPGRSKQAPGVIASVEFVDTPITTVFKMISDLTGWSIVMSPAVSSKPPKINLWIKNLTADQVLEEVATAGGLVLDRRGNTIKVLKLDEYARIHGVEQKILTFKYASAKEVSEVLKPFAGEKENQSIIQVSESANRVILLAPKPLLKSLTKLAEALDIPLEKDCIEIVELTHLNAGTIVELLEEFLGQASGGAKGSKPRTAEAGGEEPRVAGQDYLVRFLPVPQLSLVVLRGVARDIERAKTLISQLDVPVKLDMVKYQPKHINVNDMMLTVGEILRDDVADRGGEQSLRLAVNTETNSLLAEGNAEDLERLSKIIELIDVPLPPGTGAIRIYRLENTSSSEVAVIIENLIKGDGDKKSGWLRKSRQGKSSSGEDGIRRVDSLSQRKGGPSEKSNTDLSVGGTDAREEIEEKESVLVTAVQEINAVIIRASAAEHEELAKIIEELDKPREQVLLEVTLVVVRSDEGFNLGVELGSARVGKYVTEYVGFTHFGVGSVDTATGNIRLPTDPSNGLSFALFGADDFSFVLNALKAVGDVRITSSPKIMVEDNATATIRQLSQQPFEVTEQGETTSTTTFGGYVDAGTLLTVTPYISEHDWLRVDYGIMLSSFGIPISASLPPPRFQNEIQGTVRIPADHVVVLGGLATSRRDKTVDSVPLLEKVPLLGEFFKNRERSELDETLFVFIKPTILRDTAFRDLLFISKEDAQKAKLSQQEYPQNPLKTLVPPAAALEGLN